jgi:hypothetical protein
MSKNLVVHHRRCSDFSRMKLNSPRDWVAAAAEDARMSGARFQKDGNGNRAGAFSFEPESTIASG